MKSPTPEECSIRIYTLSFQQVKYTPEKCAAGIYHPHIWGQYQCSRKPGHGAHGLYCKQHAKRYPVEE